MLCKEAAISFSSLNAGTMTEMNIRTSIPCVAELERVELLQRVLIVILIVNLIPAVDL
jgi:hypothetical protein